jgi:hypothetical protein
VSQSGSIGGRSPVSPGDIRVESVGVRAIDLRRVDVAVDLTPCRAAVDVEMVIVGPDDDELCSIRLVDNRQATLDRIMHLRQDAQSGEHTLFIGVFHEGELVARADRTFAFPLAEAS